MDLTKMSESELRALVASAQQELANRTCPCPQSLAVYTHDCAGASKHHKAKYKHWSKLVRGVDTTKTSGYAWIGEFLPTDGQVKVPTDSIVVEVCGDIITAYRITGGGKERIDYANTKWQAKLIDTVAKLLANGGEQKC